MVGTLEAEDVLKELNGGEVYDGHEEEVLQGAAGLEAVAHEGGQA